MKAHIYFIKMLVLIVLLIPATMWGQEEAQQEEAKKEKKLDLFPAISYSPETGLTMGGIGYYYLDLAPKDQTNRRSFVKFLAIYTTQKQMLLETEYELFTARNDFRVRGEFKFQFYPDRNYGIGNDADNLLYVWKDDAEVADTLNYLPIELNRIIFKPVVLKKVTDNLYAGLQFDLEQQFNYEIGADKVIFANEASKQNIESLENEGRYSGIGINLLYDNRENLINPLSGTYAELSNYFYGKWVGSEFQFNSYKLDVRQFINPVKSHTIALRSLVHLNSAENPTDIPMRRLARVGGHNNFRGYFRGTFQDQHLWGLAAEYRLPFWKEDMESKLWQVWKRVGIVGFANATQVFGAEKEFNANDFNVAVGGGLRILFNKESRLNLRIDYAMGLTPNAGGLDKRQSGIYFFLGESF